MELNGFVNTAAPPQDGGSRFSRLIAVAIGRTSGHESLQNFELRKSGQTRAVPESKGQSTGRKRNNL
jgi:hypothetical protein